MRLRLKISRQDDVDDYSAGKRFRFAVVDLDKAKTYPLNFVCMLPLRLSYVGKEPNSFVRAFGDRSLEVAKKLIVDALDAEQDADVKGELERRLKLLEPSPMSEKACASCGKLFQAKPKQWFKQKYCPECVKKRYGSRE